MKLLVMTIKDRATNQYGNPWMAISTGHAMRIFNDTINDANKENQMYQHPDDFDLYELGSWDSETGNFDTKQPTQLATGKQVAIRNT